MIPVLRIILVVVKVTAMWILQAANATPINTNPLKTEPSEKEKKTMNKLIRIFFFTKPLNI